MAPKIKTEKKQSGNETKFNGALEQVISYYLPVAMEP